MKILALLLLLSPALLAQQTTPDPRVREYVSPVRVLWQSLPEQGVVLDSALLLQPFSGQVSVENASGCVLRNYGKPPAVLLDFGRELHGGVQIAVADLEGSPKENRTVRVGVRFGESASEAMSDLGGDKDATNDHAIRDQTILLPWLGTAEFGNTGFRFVRLDLLDTNSSVTLKAVRAVFLHCDLPMLGSFRCSDERLNRIWQTGAYTVFLNCQDYLWDGIKRDRMVWAGDLHTETAVVSSVFGALPLVPASLNLLRNGTPLPKWMNGISSYSIWWLMTERDWYRYTGDLTRLRQEQAYVKELLRQLTRCIGPDGRETLPEMRFLDWPNSEDKNAVHAGLQALMMLGIGAGSNLASALGDAAAEKECTDALALLRKHVPDPGTNKSAAALMVLAGVSDAAKFNRRILAVDGAKGISPFLGYYVLQARARAGDYQGGIDVIRQFWGAMLDLGATTFWEDFDLDWTPNASRIDELVLPGKKDIHGDFGRYTCKGFRRSLCHGWSAGPTAWLTEHVLGVQVLAPGYAKVRIQPHLGDLQFVEGSFPTPKGVIKVRHQKQPDGKVKSDIQAPPGITVER